RLLSTFVSRLRLSRPRLPPRRSSDLALRQAVETGDLRRLLDVLAPDVLLVADGGGIAPAATTPLVGVDEVAGLLMRRVRSAVSLRPALVNGYPALVIRSDDRVETVMAVRVEGGLITELYVVRNPEKLSRMERETAVSR